MQNKKWFIPAVFALSLPTYGGEETLWSKKGYIGLYSKNSLKIYYFRNPIECIDRYGWIAERRSVPSQFIEVILEYK